MSLYFNFYHKRICLSLLGLIVFGFNIQAQMLVQGDFMEVVDSLVDNFPLADSNSFIQPDTMHLSDIQETIELIIDQKYSAANLKALDFEYELNLFYDEPEDRYYYWLHPNLELDHHWGHYFFNAAPCRSNLIIQSPHPINDFKTGQEGAYSFRYTQAFSFMISGTHRCNHSNRTECAGTTSACDDESLKWRISDMAHNDTTMFQQVTQVLLDEIHDPYIVQLHGFTKKETDPYVILSNSSTEIPTISKDHLLELSNQLYLQDTSLTFKIAHIDDWDRLIGLVNIQGRYTNGSPNPCGQGIADNSGRFLHVEQEKYKLRADEVGWQKMAVALANTFTTLHLDEQIENDRFYTARDSIYLNIIPEIQDSINLTSNMVNTIQLNAGLTSKFVIAIPNGCN